MAIEKKEISEKLRDVIGQLDQTYSSRVNPLVQQKQSVKPVKWKPISKTDKQNGWNCFDLAAGFKRDTLVKYALANAKEITFRNLLAPEIRHAAAITVVYMDKKKALGGKDKELKPDQIQRIIKLFNIADALKDTTKKDQIELEACELLEEPERKAKAELASLARSALPESMHTEALVKIMDDYFLAHESMKAAVAACNNALGYPERQRLSLEELDDFFSNAGNRHKFKDAYDNFAKHRTKLFEPAEKSLDEYCTSQANYTTYVRDYYGANKWFAFQRHFANNRETSMVDIAAIMLGGRIFIHTNQETQEVIYRTANYGDKEIHVEYNGVNHFVGLVEEIPEREHPLAKDHSPHLALEPRLTGWATPAVVAQLATPQKSETYSMSHLLASGFRGTEYQLIVLLSELTKLLAGGKQFEAVFEARGFGNLDDIGLVVKEMEQVVAVNAFQVKYYNHPITVYDFFNEDVEITEKTSGKNEKMHIGKFFDGWLAWKSKYPHVSDTHFKSIVYSNAALDETLIQCVTKHGLFTHEFVQRTKVVYVGRQEKITVKIPKIFLTKLKNVEVSKHHSTKVWLALQNAGLLDKEGNLTKKFDPKAPVSSLPLPKLPHGLSAKMIHKCLKEVHDVYLLNRIDLYELLYQEAWSYLKAKGYHQTITAKTDQAKQVLFRQFLYSLRLQVAQEDIATLEVSIQKNLTTILNDSPEQVYLCLYYALREWFRKEYSDNQVPKLTNGIMNGLLKKSLVQSRDVVLLQGHTKATLSHISYACGNQTVVRAELSTLEKALSGSGLVMVVGEKGMGKSGLMKQVLLDRHPTEYLALSAVDLVEDPKLRTMVLDVVNKIEAIRVVALDGAEALLRMNDLELKKLFSTLESSGRVIVLTVTEEAYRKRFSAMNGVVIFAQPLLLDNIVQKFPELARYRHINRLMELAQIPFYLSAIIKLINQIGTKEFDYIIKIRNMNLEAELMKMIMEGQDASTISIRRRAWQKLALKMFDINGNFSQEVVLSTVDNGLLLLIKEGIVVQRNNRYCFAHDLYFEHAMMAFWFQKWEIASVEGNTNSFWSDIAKSLQNPFARSLSEKWLSMQNSFLRTIFEKWLSIYREQLSDDLIECIDTIVKTDYFDSIVAMAIVAHDDRLLAVFLKANKRSLERTLDAFGHFSTTFALLAIWYNNPNALQMLVKYGVGLHHPHAGSLVLDLSFASYCQPLDKSIEESEDDTISNDDDVEAAWDTHSFTSERSESEPEEEILQELPEDPFDGIIERFSDNLNKYWSAGFDEEPGVLDEEGEWQENPDYQERPQYHTFYVHQTVMLNRGDCLSVLLGAYKEKQQAQVFQLHNQYSETPLHVGVLNNANEAVTVLLKEDISVNVADFWGETPLHNAAYTGNLILAELPLSKGANPNSLNGVGLTAFHIVLARLDLAMVKLFMTYGADISLSPFSRVTEGMTVADLLENQWERDGKREEVEDFVLQLIALLNYGSNEDGFKWATKCEEIDPKARQAQLDEVSDLMTLVEHRAQLSECFPGFDYWDQDSELEYTIENGDVEKLEDLEDYILEDPDRIEDVLEAEAFSSLKEEILDQWFETATETQYQNLKRYALEYENEDVLKRVFGDVIDYGNVDELRDFKDYILENLDRIEAVLVAPRFASMKEAILKHWFDNAIEAQYLNLKQYADKSSDEDVLKFLEGRVNSLDLESIDDDPSDTPRSPTSPETSENGTTLLFSNSLKLESSKDSALSKLPHQRPSLNIT